MMHFPMFQISPLPLFRIFHNLGQFFQLFPKKLMFHPPKILSITSKVLVSPLFFAKTLHLPPIKGNFFFPSYFGKFLLPISLNLHDFCLLDVFFFVFLPTLTMMHLCFTQCTCWTPLSVRCCSYKLALRFLAH